ncbi:MAG: hypothetical protein M3P96_06625 [Actinomycetota bacterium]|nr:hypothetical protein [Actinomycetota bacterium]
MATKRSNQSWGAPRSGGYSARSTGNGRGRSAVTGRFVDQSTGTGKPAPPKGRGAASDGRAREASSDR